MSHHHAPGDEGTLLNDVPPLVMLERRRMPDPRRPWRGGRRDTDWINRPLGALARLAAAMPRWFQQGTHREAR